VTDWSKAKAPYGIRVPRPVVAVLENVRDGLAFEEAVAAPAPTRTPNWYVRELALQAYERAFQEQVISLVDLLADWYPATANKLAEAKMPDAVGAVLSRGIEAVWKLERHVAEWEQIASDLRTGPLLVDVMRPTWDWGGIRARVGALRTELLRQLSLSIPAHAVRQRDPDIPDYLGEAVHRVGEAAFEVLVENDDELFAQFFSPYFIGVFVIVDRIKPQVASWQPQIASTALSEPVIDAMELSGYALIFSELHRNPKLWEVCQKVWRGYFQETGGKDRLTIVAAMHKYQRNLFALTHRATVRTRWQMAANEILGNLPRCAPTHPWGEGEVQHESALIRRIAPDGDLMFSPYNASDIFAVSFLRTLPGGASLDFGVSDWVADVIAPVVEEADVREQQEPSNEALVEGEDSPNDDAAGTVEE
jgi:hypothetical protein